MPLEYALLKKLTEKRVLPMEVTHPNTSKISHDLKGPNPCSPCLNTIPNYVLNGLDGLWEAKNALFENRSGV